MKNFFLSLYRRDTIITYQINEYYVWALIYILGFFIGRGLAIFIYHRLTTKPTIHEPNRGGDLRSADIAAANALIACVADNNSYIVSNPELVKLLFSMLKENAKQTKLVIAPTLVRVMANQVINLSTAQHSAVKILNLLSLHVQSTARPLKLITKGTLAAAGGLIMGYSHVVQALGMIQSGVLGLASWIIISLLIDNCFINCNDYLLSVTTQPIEIYSQFPKSDHIVITDKGPDSVEVYVPVPVQKTQTDRKFSININPNYCNDETPITFRNTKNKDVIDVEIEARVPDLCIERKLEKQPQTTFERSRKKAKEVKFSDFRRTDPVLSQYQNLEEEYVPQNPCPIKELATDIKKEIISMEKLEPINENKKQEQTIDLTNDQADY
jgi:hypothetical protein